MTRRLPPFLLLPAVLTVLGVLVPLSYLVLRALGAEPGELREIVFRSRNLVLAGKALAFLRGRDFARPQDVRDLARDVMRHRMVLSYEALAEGLNADAVIDRVLKKIPVLDKPLATHA